MSLQLNYYLFLDTVYDILNIAGLPHNIIEEISKNDDLSIQMQKLLKSYTMSIHIPKSNHFDLKQKILYHLSFFKFQLEHYLTNECFYESIEDLLVFYCQLELVMVCKKFQSLMHITEDTELQLHHASDRILTILKLYLDNNEKYIFRVLLKIKYRTKSKISYTIMRILYCQVLNIYPMQCYFTEAFCRKYIILMKLMDLMPDQEVFVSKAMKKLTRKRFIADCILNLIYTVNNSNTLILQSKVFYSTNKNVIFKESLDNTVIFDDNLLSIDDIGNESENAPPMKIMDLIDFNNYRASDLNVVNKLLAMNVNRRKLSDFLITVNELYARNEWNLIICDTLSTCLVDDKTLECDNDEDNIPSKDSESSAIILKVNIFNQERLENEYGKHKSGSIDTDTLATLKFSEVESLSVESILMDGDIISKCLDKDRTTINILTDVNILRKLILLVTTEANGTNLEESYRAYLILCAAIPSLREFMIENIELQNLLSDFVRSKRSLNPTLASYYTTIMTMFVVQNKGQCWKTYKAICSRVLDHIRNRKLITNLLNHIETPAIKDLLMVLMTQVQLKHRILKYLNSVELIQNLVKLLHPKFGRPKNDSASELLHEFSQIAYENRRTCSKGNKPDPLLAELELPSTIGLILNVMFAKPKSESSLVGGTKVLVGLLRFEKSTLPKFYYPQSYIRQGVNNMPEDVAHIKLIKLIAKVVVERLNDFHSILLHPPKKVSFETTVGSLNVPLGQTRIQVALLLSLLIKADPIGVTKAIIPLSSMKVLLDLFFEYSLNNFFHTQVYACILAAFQTYVSSSKAELISLAEHLLVECRLVDRIYIVFKKIDPKVIKNRPGYMGHLVNIANVVADYCAVDKPLGHLLQTRSPRAFKLLEQLKAGRLREIVMIYMKPLGSNNSRRKKKTMQCKF